MSSSASPSPPSSSSAPTSSSTAPTTSSSASTAPPTTPAPATTSTSALTIETKKVQEQFQHRQQQSESKSDSGSGSSGGGGGSDGKEDKKRSSELSIEEKRLLEKKQREDEGKTPRAAFESFLNRPLLHIRDGVQVLVIGMVGLPARGKTYVGGKISRYLSWLGYKSKVFNLGVYRRERVGGSPPADFFDPNNSKGSAIRNQIVRAALDDMVTFFHGGGQAAIIDATNSTRERRKMISEYLRASPFSGELIWIESVCTDASLIASNVTALSPDYSGMQKDEAIEDFKARIGHYEATYETVDEDELGPDHSCVKLYDTGRKVTTLGIKGYLPTRLVFFLMNLDMHHKKSIFFSRHGQSEYNVSGKIGGDSNLSSLGREYATKLAEFINAQPEVEHVDSDGRQKLKIWCSTLKRTIQTAQVVYDLSKSPGTVVRWRALAEINAGLMDGRTYEEINQVDPLGFEARKKDKLNYKYPQGESYKDVIDRVERVIFELERTQAPVLVVGHQAVIRCLYGYFLDLPLERIPLLDVPLHTVIKITPDSYECKEERFVLCEDAGNSHGS